tara:strand:+ start:88 stop:528 length:441 start_codon:yes stop_codon:yes gene_type:complete
MGIPLIPIYGILLPFLLFVCGISLYFYHIFHICKKRHYSSILTAKQKKYKIIYIFNSAIFLIFLSFVLYLNFNIYNFMTIVQSLYKNAFITIRNINNAALHIQHTTKKLNDIIDNKLYKVNVSDIILLRSKDADVPNTPIQPNLQN